MLQVVAHAVPVAGVLLSLLFFEIDTWLLIAIAVLGMIILNRCTGLPHATGNEHRRGAFPIIIFFTVASLAVPAVAITFLALLDGWMPAVVAGVLCLVWAVIPAFSPPAVGHGGKVA